MVEAAGGTPTATNSRTPDPDAAGTHTVTDSRVRARSPQQSLLKAENKKQPNYRKVMRKNSPGRRNRKVCYKCVNQSAQERKMHKTNETKQNVFRGNSRCVCAWGVGQHAEAEDETNGVRALLLRYPGSERRQLGKSGQTKSTSVEPQSLTKRGQYPLIRNKAATHPLIFPSEQQTPPKITKNEKQGAK